MLIIDDLISQGGSVLRTAAMLEEFNMEVRDAVVLVDRSSDAAERLESSRLQPHPHSQAEDDADLLL